MILLFVGNGIKDDILKMGTILNWDKEYYTMDEVNYIIHIIQSKQILIIHFHVASIVCSC